MKKILIIEDEKILREALKEGLAMSDWQIFEAGDGKTAREIFSQEEIELILVDIKLPDESGINLLREFKHSNPGLKVIVLTAYEAYRSDFEIWAEGLLDYIVKPVDLSALKKKIENIFKKS